MKKIITVVGARPQFIKAAAVSRAIQNSFSEDIQETIVHTGQHFDSNMSGVFFDQLGIPTPKYNLEVSGGPHGEMTGRMLMQIEEVLLNERPDWVLVYGDTNSTLAGALAAAKLNIRVAHVEAGLRSFNMRMPEEINRIIADRVSALLLCPSQQAVANLLDEGIRTGCHFVGDVMYDAALFFGQMTLKNLDVLTRLQVSSKSYVLATCHRAENTDNIDRLTAIVRGLAIIAKGRPVVFPVHPRTRNRITDVGLLHLLHGVTLVDPLSYLEMLALEKHAEVVVTDSGGVQKEAFFYRVPCVTIRNETEWVETVDAGWNVLVGANTDKLINAVENHTKQERFEISPYGSGDAAHRVLQQILVA